MNAFVTSFNQKLGVNPIVGRMIDAIPGLVRVSPEEAEVVILLFIAPDNDFVLDVGLLERASKRNAPVIVFDYTETFPPNFILGEYSLSSIHMDAVRAFVNKSRLLAYFKRELLSNHTLPKAAFPIYPIEWTMQDQPQPHIDTPEQFESRPIDILMSWGYSNESRPKIHGELMRQSGRFGAHLCLTEEDVVIALKEGRNRIFALLFTPHYRRIPLTQLLSWQEYSKVSISMFGAGKKCFRTNEASYNCVMAHQEPNLVEWAYPWTPPSLTNGGGNCLALPSEEQSAVTWLYNDLRVNQGSLHPLYLRGMENNRKYHNTTYARDYLLPKIQEALK